MEITSLELSLERGNSGEFEHEGYFDSIDDLIRYLKKLKRKENKSNDNEGDWWE